MQCLHLGFMVKGGLNFDGALNFLLYHNFWLNDFIPVSVLQGWRYTGSETPLSSTAAAHQNSTASDLPPSPADSLNASHTWRSEEKNRPDRRMSKRTDRLQSKAGITRWNSPAVKNAPTAVWVLHCQTGSAISVLVTLCHRPLFHLTTRHRRRNHLFTHHTWTQRWPRASTPGICVNVIVTHIKSALIHIFLLSVSRNFAICYYEWPYVLVMERP